MKKVLTYGGAFLISMVLIAWKLNSNKAHNEEKIAIVKESSSGAIPVKVSKVSKTTVNKSFSENGTFEPINQIELTSEVAGRVRELFVKEGSFVRAGQAIAKIDNEILNADFAAKQAQLAQAKQDLSRYEQALATGGVTQKQVDDARLQLQNAQAQFVQTSKNLNNALVKAPVSGIINKRFVEVGTYLSLGNKIVEIIDDKKLKLTVNVNEYQVMQLKTGDKIKVTASVYPETSFDGIVTFIAAKSDESLNYPIEIEIKENSGKPLKAGMYGTAHFEPIKDSPYLVIPRSAFQGGINSNQIFIADNGKAKLMKVVAGQSFGEWIEVRKGIQEGDTVVTSGQINLIDETPITIIQ